MLDGRVLEASQVEYKPFEKRAGLDHVNVPRRKQRVVPAPDVARIVGSNFDKGSANRLCGRKTAPAVLACLITTTSTTKHAQARARLKQFRMLGPIFF